MGIFGVNLDEINLDDNNNIYEDDPGITIHVRLLAWQKMWKTQSTQKNVSTWLMPVAWDPISGIGACQKMRKNEVEPVFTDVLKVVQCF